MTREIEIDLNDWNFSKSINIGTISPNNSGVFFSEELRILIGLQISVNL